MNRRGFLTGGAVLAGGAAFAKTSEGLLIPDPTFVHELDCPAITFTGHPRDVSVSLDVESRLISSLGGRDEFVTVARRHIVSCDFEALDFTQQDALTKVFFEGGQWEITIARKKL